LIVLWASRSTEIQTAARNLVVRESDIGLRRAGAIFGQSQKAYSHDRILERLWRHLDSVFNQTETLKETLTALADKPDC